MDFIAVQNGFIMMSHKRFQEMPVSVCGFDYSDLSGGQDKESWFCVNRLLEKLHPLEELLFANSAKYLTNRRDSILVVDDKLNGSRASDVELKVISERKAAKEGMVSHCIADSQLSFLLGMRLWCKGELQAHDVEKLLNQIGEFPLTTSTELSCDRGYGKMLFVVD
jgi:hypothetical protein